MSPSDYKQREPKLRPYLRRAIVVGLIYGILANIACALMAYGAFALLRDYPHLGRAILCT